MPDSRETLARIRKRANRAALMIDIGPTSDKEWELCATAALADVPWLLEQVELRGKALDDVRALHFERAELACGNPTHTVPDLMCPDCLTVCDDCGAPWPCATVEAITTTIEGETRA